MTTVNVKNNHSRTLNIGGVDIAPGATAPVPDFERVSESHAVKAWAEKGIIGPAEMSEDRDELKKQAEELGIDFPKNISTDKLKKLVDAKLAE